MRPKTLRAGFVVGLLILCPLSRPLVGQSLEARVEIQIQAALQVVREHGGSSTTLLYPQAGETRDSISELARAQLVDRGFSEYTAPGIPDAGVGLLGLDGFGEDSDGLEVYASLHFFSSEREGGLRGSQLHIYFYRYVFPVTCQEISCAFRESELVSYVHGDGWLPIECADTYFASTEDKPEACRRDPAKLELSLGSDGLMPVRVGEHRCFESHLTPVSRAGLRMRGRA